MSVLHSLCSLVSLMISKSPFFILKQTKPFTPLHQNLSSFFTPLGCQLLLLLPHTPPNAAASLCFHFPPRLFSASQTRLRSLRSVKVSSFFIPLFLYFVFVIWVYQFVQMFFFFFLISNKNHMKKQLKGSCSNLKLKD